MPVSLQLCKNVSHLRSEGKTVAQIARAVNITWAVLEEAHWTLLLPTVYDILEDRAVRTATERPSAEERRAARDRVPKKIGAHIRKRMEGRRNDRSCQPISRDVPHSL